MKHKNVLASILLLIVFLIIKIFLGGVYFYHFFEELLPELVVLVLISFIMMIVPTIVRILNKKRLEHKKGIKICLFNSLVITILLIIPNIITIMTKEVDMTMSFDPIGFAKNLIMVLLLVGVIYYFINYLFYVEEK